MVRVHTPSGDFDYAADNLVQLYDAQGAPHPDFTSAIKRPDSRLLTTSIGDGLQDERVANALAVALVERMRTGITAPIYIVACENTITSLWLRTRVEQLSPELAEQRRLGRPLPAVFLPCVIDRTCTKIEIVEDRTVVTASDHATWLIQKGPSPELESILSSATAVRTRFVNNTEMLWCMKLWTVNCLHLAFALIAARNGWDDLHYYARTSKGTVYLHNLVKEIGIMISPRFTDRLRPLLKLLLNRTATQLSRQPDFTSRILRKMWSSPTSFARDSYFKMGIPMDAFLRNGGTRRDVSLLSSINDDMKPIENKGGLLLDFQASLRRPITDIA